eukprot:XP_001694689.1 predicted protein [Chlamydomonas reinhardtii]
MTQASTQLPASPSSGRDAPVSGAWGLLSGALGEEQEMEQAGQRELSLLGRGASRAAHGSLACQRGPEPAQQGSSGVDEVVGEEEGVGRPADRDEHQHMQWRWPGGCGQMDVYLYVNCQYIYLGDLPYCNIIFTCADCAGGVSKAPWNITLFNDPNVAPSPSRVSCPTFNLDDAGNAALLLNYNLGNNCPDLPDDSSIVCKASRLKIISDNIAKEVAAGMLAAICTQLSVDDCSTIKVACVGVGGLNASLTVFPAMPDSAYGYGDNCSARVTATFSLPASAAGQQALFVLNVAVPGYAVTSPTTQAELRPEHTAEKLRNGGRRENIISNSGSSKVPVSDQKVALSIATTLGLPPDQVFIVTGPSGNTTGGGSGGGGILTPLSTPPPPPASRCDSPRLGSLCGAEAVGAIVGIIVGGLLLLGLLIGLAYSLISRGRQPVLPVDDYAWVQKYAHVAPGLATAYTPPVFRATPYSVDLNHPTMPGQAAHSSSSTLMRTAV